jgi:hypothetical protein
MSDPTPFTLDDQQADDIRRAAASEGVSPREFLRTRLGRQPGPPPWIETIARQRFERGPPKSMEEQLQSMMQMQMYRQFFGDQGGHRGLDARDIADAVGEVLDRRLSPGYARGGPNGGSNGEGTMRERLMPILELKLMMKMVGGDEDPAFKAMIANMEKDLRDQLLRSESSVKELKDQITRKELDAERERSALEVAALRESMDDLRAQLHNQPPPPKVPSMSESIATASTEIRNAKKALDEVRATFGGPGSDGKTGGVDLDTIERGLDMGLNALERGLNARGQYMQISQGRPPVQPAPQSGPPAPPPAGNYSAGPPAAAPAPAQRAPPAQPPAAAAADAPAAQAPASGGGGFPPGSHFIDPGSGEEIPEALFMERYGRAVAAAPGRLQVSSEPPGPTLPPAADAPA